MLIMMGLNAPQKDIETVKRKIIKAGCTPHEIPGSKKLAIGVTGASEKLESGQFLVLPSVEQVIPVTKKFKLVSRIMKPNDTVIDFGNASIGGKELNIIAGPCSVEDRDTMFRIAEELKNLGLKFMRGGAYKPRSSPYAFQGLKEKGLKILDEVKKEFDLKIVTEVLNPRNLKAVAEVADILQLGSRNMQNFALLQEAGAIGKPILLKRGMSATIEDFLLSAEYIISQNNYNVILCERGIRTFETATRNTLDLNAVPVIKTHSHLPVVVDPSHGIGIGAKVPAMALSAIAAGANGLILEVHTEPSKAWSDGYQTISIETLKNIMVKIKRLAPVVDKEFHYNER